jgi:hypothetical protein
MKIGTFKSKQLSKKCKGERDLQQNNMLKYNILRKNRERSKGSLGCFANRRGKKQ